MRILKYSAALLAVLVTVACTQQEDAAPAAAAPSDVLALDTTDKRLSYSIAFGLGQRLQQDGVPLDIAAFSAGIEDAFSGNEPLLTQEEIGAEMQAYQEIQAKEQAAHMEQLAEQNASTGAAFLAENAKAEDVVVLDSGLQYKVITAGTGPKPTATDTVEVHYRGTLIDGTEFDSSYAKGSTVSFGVNQVIAGWTEALQLMPSGSKWQLFVPSDLAYGAGGAGGIIGPNATLIFDVELMQITPQG